MTMIIIIRVLVLSAQKQLVTTRRNRRRKQKGLQQSSDSRQFNVMADTCSLSQLLYAALCITLKRNRMISFLRSRHS